MKYNIVIIGGGIIGSAIAYFLARTGQAGNVAVIEPDASYSRAATSQAAGGVRQLFNLPENIQMSRYAVDFYANFAHIMAVEKQPAEIDFRQQGYLFVVSSKGARQLEINARRQADEGVQVELLDCTALAARFPAIGLADVALACYSPEDGWLDSASALQGFRRKAIALGVTYIEDRVTALDSDKQQLTEARLQNGASVQAEIFINAAGAWAGEVGAMIGMRLPLQPMCRLQHYWHCQDEVEPLPLVKDESGLFFRPEGPGFVGGRPAWDISPGFISEADQNGFGNYPHDYFDRVVWPLLIQRAPKFNTLRCQRTWAGHYAQNSLDGNMILGAWPNGAANFYVACGFSGHGIMHAPAVGLALAELILNGRYTTIDLSRMSYQRVLDDKPYREQGII